MLMVKLNAAVALRSINRTLGQEADGWMIAGLGSVPMASVTAGLRQALQEDIGDVRAFLVERSAMGGNLGIVAVFGRETPC
jgi:hypothetical protein